jgi:hypothetical protein
MVRLATLNLPKMQRSGGYWNQDSGAIDKVVSELLATLSTQEVRSGLSRLAKKLADLRASDARPRVVTSGRLRPRRPGWVLDAVVRAFGDQAGPMRLMDIHAAMEQELSQSVSIESVSWCLRMGTRGLDPQFIRVARGRYALVELRR